MELSIGKNNFTIDGTRHVAVLGGSGQGKTTLLLNLFVSAVRAGWSVGVVDPHGDFADACTSYIPRSLARLFLWVDLRANRIPPFNPLYFTNEAEKELGGSTFFTTIKSLAGSAWGDESARVTINAIDSAYECYEHPTPVHAFRFMADKKFRNDLLSRTENPMLRMFKDQYDNDERGEGLRPSETMSKFSPPINKLSKLMRPEMLPLIGQTKSISLLDKIFVVRASKGQLGDETAQLLGTFFVNKVSIDALKRERMKVRKPFMLIVDEVYNFAHGGRFSSLLAEARKYGITLVTAFQSSSQVPFIDDILANSATQIVFNCSGKDAELMADNWREDHPTDGVKARDITHLPRFQFYCRTLKEDKPEVSLVRSLPSPTRRGDEAKATTLIKASLERWGKDPREIRKKVDAFLASSGAK